MCSDSFPFSLQIVYLVGTYVAPQYFEDEKVVFNEKFPDETF